MNTPPLVGPVIRIAVALLLCAASFQAGRWYQTLSVPAGASDQASPVATLPETPEAAPNLIETAPSAAPGSPFGKGEDIITPLNVRDPSALVMGPAGMRKCTPPPAVVPDPFAKEAKPRKRKKGLLLELLKKDDKNSPAPKNF